MQLGFRVMMRQELKLRERTPHQIARFLYKSALKSMKQLKFRDAISDLQSALVALKGVSRKSVYAYRLRTDTHIELGICFCELNDSKQAFNNFTEALTLAQKLEDQPRLQIIQGGLTWVNNNHPSQAA